MLTISLQRALLALLVVTSVATAAAAAPAGTININTADAAELTLLPRVGPAVAQRVIEHRLQNGAFKSLDDLMLVKGIGERTFELLRPYVTLEGESTLTEKVAVPRAKKPSGSGEPAGER